MSEPDPKQEQRLRWQCRRGLLELDYIFEDYLDKRYDSAPEEERAQFRALLNELDPDLQAWILHGATPPEQFAEMVTRLRGE